MTDVFDMTESVNRSIAQIEALDPSLLAKPLDEDPVAGPEAVEALLTFLPPESRKAALVGFVMAMLCD